MTLAELRAELTDDVLQRAGALSWPRVELADLGHGRVGYVSGAESWRSLCGSLSLAELRGLTTVLANPRQSPPARRNSGPARVRRADAMTINTGDMTNAEGH